MNAQTSDFQGPDRHRIGVAIVDRDEKGRSLMENLLAGLPLFDHLGSYLSGTEALAGIPYGCACIVLMDVRTDGIECTRLLTARAPESRIVVVGELPEPRTIERALLAGAVEFLCKPFSEGQFLAALMSASFHWHPVYLRQGAPFLRTSGAQPLISDEASASRKEQCHLSLTPRESAVAALVSRGYRNKEIADHLRPSVFVVEKVLKSLFRKMSASNRAEVAARAPFVPVARAASAAEGSVFRPLFTYQDLS